MAPHEHSQQHEQRRQHAGEGSRRTWVLIGFLAIAAYFLFSEHRAHFIYYLPFLLLLACPLLHMFHGHGRRGEHGQKEVEQHRDRGPLQRERADGDSQ